MNTRIAKKLELTPISDAEFNQIVQLADKVAGLSLPSSKKTLVQARIAKRLRALNLNSFTEYISYYDAKKASETPKLISALTTNVTSFYREQHHFDLLAKAILPRLRSRLFSGESVRFWSAGCSAGHEPYSLAIDVLNFCPNAIDYDFKILATDIDLAILQCAKRGIFNSEDVQSLNVTTKNGFFVRQGDSYQINEKVRKLVDFRELNLHSEWPMLKPFDAIFCRNVIIYFSDSDKRALWPRFHSALSPSGLLCLGHSERINPIKGSGFKSVDITSYQRQP